MTGFATKQAMASERQMGKSMASDWLKQFMAGKQRPKIIWQQLPGRKLKATWNPEQGQDHVVWKCLASRKRIWTQSKNGVRIQTVANVSVLTCFNLAVTNTLPCFY